jgi:hypothetical protein
MTGILADSATSPKLASSASAIQGSGSWHVPHRGVPAAAAGTRFVLPHFLHRIKPLFITSFSTLAPDPGFT